MIYSACSAVAFGGNGYFFIFFVFVSEDGSDEFRGVFLIPTVYAADSVFFAVFQRDFFLNAEFVAVVCQNVKTIRPFRRNGKSGKIALFSRGGAERTRTGGSVIHLVRKFFFIHDFAVYERRNFFERKSKRVTLRNGQSVDFILYSGYFACVDSVKQVGAFGINGNDRRKLLFAVFVGVFHSSYNGVFTVARGYNIAAVGEKNRIVGFIPTAFTHLFARRGFAEIKFNVIYIARYGGSRIGVLFEFNRNVVERDFGCDEFFRLGNRYIFLGYDGGIAFGGSRHEPESRKYGYNAD